MEPAALRLDRPIIVAAASVVAGGLLAAITAPAPTRHATCTVSTPIGIGLGDLSDRVTGKDQPAVTSRPARTLAWLISTALAAVSSVRS